MPSINFIQGSSNFNHRTPIVVTVNVRPYTPAFNVVFRFPPVVTVSFVKNGVNVPEARFDNVPAPNPMSLDPYLFTLEVSGPPGQVHTTITATLETTLGNGSDVRPSTVSNP
jgi:hypothetical protein